MKNSIIKWTIGTLVVVVGGTYICAVTGLWLLVSPLIVYGTLAPLLIPKLLFGLNLAGGESTSLHVSPLGWLIMILVWGVVGAYIGYGRYKNIKPKLN